MATSLLSLALDKALDPTIAMTGELTVTGKVLRIGGLREKTVAARRAGAKTIIFPADNTSDWLELPKVCGHRLDLSYEALTFCNQNIKEGIDGHAASWYSDVFNLVFPNVDTNEVNNLWKAQLEEADRGSRKVDDED